MASGSYAKKFASRPRQDESTAAIPLRATRSKTTIGVIEKQGPETEALTFSKECLYQPTTRPSHAATTRTTRTKTSLPATDPMDTIMLGQKTLAQGMTKKPTRNLASEGLDTGISTTQTTTNVMALGVEPTALGIEPETRVNPVVMEQTGVIQEKIARRVDADSAVRADIVALSSVAILKRNGPWLRPWIVCTVFAVIALLVLISAGIFQRNDTINMNYGSGQAYSVQVGTGTWAKNPQPAPLQKKITSNPGPYAVLGKPTISAAFINQVLQAYHSPAAGKGQTLYNMGVQYGIDPAFALAFFMHESSFGTAGEARTTLSLGNLRCYSGATCIDQDRGGYAQYASWEDGFQAWYELIHNYYIAQLGKVTIEQIIPTYAPTADNNNELAYIAFLKHAIDTWHAGQIYVN
jgi:Mannosyl-glycoprotein endo-beta-N-acetylglucosaminidase.